MMGMSSSKRCEELDLLEIYKLEDTKDVDGLVQVARGMTLSM